jgi:acyl dehydratase
VFIENSTGEACVTQDAAGDEAFEARLQACVAGARGRDMPAPYAVNEAMIGMWTDALLDDNPVYVDAAAAQATGRPGVIAPPAMVQAWIMPKLSKLALGATDVPGFAPWFGKPGAQRSGEGPHEVFAILAERGYVNSLAVQSKQTYHREMQPGDHVHCISSVDSVSPLKRTAMGAGHFVTMRLDYRDQQGRDVATQLWTFLRFKTPTEAEIAKARPAKPKTDAPPEPEARSAGAALAGAPRVGQVTEPVAIPITPSFVIATALATHDFYAIHHDVDWARSIGQPDIFTNILTTTGLVGGVMTRWGGPAVRLRSTDLRLFTPNYPGDTLTLQGRVTAVDGEEVTLAVFGKNRLGTHVEAVVVGTVPAR